MTSISSLCLEREDVIPLEKESRRLLECSRQNIEDLIQRDKLHPVKVDTKNKLFLKSEIQQRMWK